MGIIKIKLQFAIMALTLVGWALFASGNAVAAELTSRSIRLSTSHASATNVTYTVGFTVSSVYNMGSIVIEFCDNDPIPNTPCTPPSGLDVSGVNLNSETGETGFSVHANTNSNTIVLSRTVSVTVPGASTYTLGNITNPNLGNHTFYGRIYTKPTTDGSGAEVDTGGIAMSTTNQFTVNTEVPPYLTFCTAVTITGYSCSGVGSNFIDFGEFSSSVTKTATTQFIVGTNADYGFVVYAIGNSLTSGNNVINALNTPTASQKGKNQFGINLRQNTSPVVGSDYAGAGTGVPTANYNTPNLFKFVSGDALATSPTTTLGRKFTVSYIVNVKANQKPGLYATTLLYVALATF